MKRDIIKILDQIDPTEIEPHPYAEMHMVTINLMGGGREEFTGGWPLKVYPTQASAKEDFNKANEHLAAFNDSAHPDGIKPAVIALYAMFPRLHMQKLLSHYIRFDLEKVHGAI